MTGRVRVLVGLVGLVVAAYGALQLADLGWANARAAAVWLVGGVVLHDAVLAPAVLALSALALRLVPRDRLAPAVVALVLLGPVTLVAVPELGRFGADPGNPTLLDRPYWWGWTVLVTLVLAVVVLGSVVRRRRGVHRGGDRGAAGGGR